MENGIPIRSVSRSIAVLQAINRYGSLSMMSIAKQGKLPYPTAFRIVQTLVREGLIEQEPTRKHYRPTALVQSLAHGYRAESYLVDVAGGHIRRLTRDVGWPAFVTVRVGAQMVVRDATHSETSLTFGLCHPGFTVPLLTSATGQACLAYYPPAELDQVMRWTAPPDDAAAAKIDHEALNATLGRVRANGYAAKPCDNQNANKSSSIAVPIFLHGRVEAVLTLIYFTTAMKPAVALERYLGPLKRTAEAISAALEAGETRGPGLSPVEADDVIPPMRRSG